MNPKAENPSAERQAPGKIEQADCSKQIRKKQFSNLTKTSTNPVYNSLNYGQNCRQYKFWIKLLVTKRNSDKYIYVSTSQKTKAPNSNNLLTILS